MYRRRYQDSLSKGGRKLEQGTVYHFPNLLVVEQVFSLPGSNFHKGSAHKVMDPVCINSSRVNDYSGLIGFFPGFDQISLFFFQNIRYFLAEPKFYPVIRRIFRQSNGEPEGAYNPPCRSIKRRHGLFPHAGFQFRKLLPVQNTKPLHTVCLSSLLQLCQLMQILFIKTKHQGAVSPVRKIQFLRERLHLSASCHVQPCLQRTRDCIVARMHNSAVGL